MTITEFSQINKILIIRLSSLGDILLTTPFIRSIKTQYPQLRIDFVLREGYADVLKFNPYISKQYLFKSEDEENKEIYLQIKNEGYDFIIDLQNNFRSRKIISAVKASFTKFNKKTFDKFLLVNFKINRLKDYGQIPLRYSQTIPDFRLDKKGLDLFLGNDTKPQLIPGSYIGICPGARHFTKKYPKKYFVELAKMLMNTGFKIVLFGGRIDKEICSDIQTEIPNSINLCNDDKILQTAADMKLCKGVICNDSGLMHTASAVGTFVIAIFGSTVKEFGFTPYNCPNLILENKSLSCRPCSHIGRSSCPKKHFKCMQEVTPMLAFELIKNFLVNK